MRSTANTGKIRLSGRKNLWNRRFLSNQLQTKQNIQDKHKEFLAYKALSQNSRAITSVMKSFEKFLFSVGLAKFTSVECHARTFTVLDASDRDVINFCIWKSLSGEGRTHLHSIQCPLLGENTFNDDCVNMGCEKMISAEYLRAYNLKAKRRL